MQLYKEFFLSLIRYGIGHSANVLSGNVNWTAIRALAMKQGLSAVVLDGIERLPDEKRPPRKLLIEWIGDVLQGYENKQELYLHAIANLAGFYNHHNLKMMVLKGYACGMNWPRPEHRPYGDIDIWLFGEQVRGDELVIRERGITVDKSQHQHTVFRWMNFLVENHYDFLNVYAHKSSAEMEMILKELGQDDSYSVYLYGERVYIPSPNLHALFLIRHMATHFAAAEISLRHILDWAFFVEKHTHEVDWIWLIDVLEKYHLRDFFNCINGICVENLGFEAKLFPEVVFLLELKDKVLDDILEPEYGLAGKMDIFPRMAYRFRRWRGNAWKQRLCYRENRWVVFGRGIFSKILRPASLK